MLEKKEAKPKNELYVGLTEIRLTQSSAFGDQFRYVRGKGLIKRNELAK